MLEKINTLLLPLEKFIKKYRKYIGYFLLVLALIAPVYYFGFASLGSRTRESGEKAIAILWIILWIPIFARVLGIKLFSELLPLRKEMGILMGVLALTHGFSFLIPNQAYLTPAYILSSDGIYILFGMIAMWLSVPLTLTSSTWAMRKMGRSWKMLHRLVYIIVILVVIHVVALKYSRHFEIGPVIVLITYFIGKVLEWRGFTLRKSEKKSFPKGQKWICLPCGMIYDPATGDQDGGIAPGTEFVDIPESWRCPECGVTKADFVPYDETIGEKTESVKIIEKKMLNPTTLELTVETENAPSSIPGQFMTFLWHDETGTFPRSYSIAKHKGRLITFLIKLTEKGRGARVLREAQIGDMLTTRSVFGHFVLGDTQSPKVFIATGTGLAPIYNMLVALQGKVLKKSLYFSVSTEKELFYIDELRALTDLDLHIHVTREKVAGCEEGRVDIDTIEAMPETEWYLCGNPRMVSEAREKLMKRGFTKLYSEEFN